MRLLSIPAALAIVAAASTAGAAEPAAAVAPVRLPELLARGAPAGTFVLEGVVVRRYTCPPCPDGAQCKPCLSPHLLVRDAPLTPAERERPPGSWYTAGAIVWTASPERHAEGPVRLLVREQKARSSGAGIELDAVAVPPR